MAPMEYAPDLQGTLAGVPFGPESVTGPYPGGSPGEPTPADGTFWDDPLTFDGAGTWDLTLTQTISVLIGAGIYEVRVNNLHFTSSPPYVTGP